MRTLADLQSTVPGRAFLESEMTFDDPDVFLSQLLPPACDRVPQNAGRLPVYVHQQVYLDYRVSVVAKIRALRDLEQRRPQVLPEFLWIDTDRAGSDKLSLRLYLYSTGGTVAVRLAPARCEQQEPRYIQLDRVRLAEGIARMERIIASRADGTIDRLSRFNQLRPLLATDGSLADFSRGWTDRILQETLDFRPTPVLVSGLIASGALATALDSLLNRQAEFVACFNARVRALQAQDIDPQVKPLADDYLPLFMSSPVDGRRVRLKLQRDGSHHLATAVDATGQRLRYELGQGELKMSNLPDDLLWSPDVTLPLLVNEYYSGVVAGRSSTLYMLVFRDVLRKVLCVEPIPTLVPRDWDLLPGAFDSLFEAYLNGRHL